MGLFPIDSPVCLTYDNYPPRSDGSKIPSPNTVVIWFSMASTPDKSPAAAPTGTSSERRPAVSADGQVLPQLGRGDDIARELEQLRDRFRKTTNALASAAHDLKTPLGDSEWLHRIAAESETRSAQ